jgi:iron complex outermembrane recepter protein
MNLKALSVAGAISAMLPLAALSQTPVGSDTGSLAEIVVTAEKRTENIQEVPIAITAFSESDLRAKGVTDIHSLSTLTPNVNLDAGSPFSGSNSVLSA